ncbi:MAG TPA: hypothetical protein VFE78_10865 [Gemmataceae bacterium]|nr:hypothetical protein [Gemmataceae bacterium]
MLRLLTRSRRPALPAAPRPVRPSLEWLEARDCPSTVTLNVEYNVGKTITLYGEVTAGGVAGSSTPGMGNTTQLLGSMSSAPAGLPGVSVAFRGSATGSATTDANGDFTFTTQATSLGEVAAATTDGQSNTASVVLSSSAPVISNFKAYQEGTSNYWDVIGHVTDGNFMAAGLTILINGSPVTINNGGQGQKATVNANGDFDLCVKLNGTGSDNGNIDALVTDAWGKLSNEPSATIWQPGT